MTVSSVVKKGEALSIEEVMTILDETSQAIQYSRWLEEQSRELEAAGWSCAPPTPGLQELDSRRQHLCRRSRTSCARR